MSASATPTAPTPAATTAGEPDPRRWQALGVLALVSFMLVLDITVVNVALPHIQRDLGFSRAGLTWVVDGYVLTAGGLLLLGGRLADLLGRRRIFLIGIAVFVVASVTSGAAVDPGMLVASRFVQGMGEALAGPAAFGLVALLFTDPKERAKAIGMFGGVAGLGGTLGPVISGLLVGVSWRWIFFVNVPVGALALIAVPRLVHESRADQDVDRGRPDIGGAALATGGLVGIVYGLIRAADHAWGSPSVIVPLIAGAVAFVCFVLVERTIANPLVPLKFFTNRTRVTANIVTVFFSTAFFSLFFLLTLYWQDVLGWSALRSGLAYLPFGVGITAGIGVAAVLVPRIGIRALLAAAFFLFTIGMALLGRITPHGSYASQALPALLALSVASGFMFAGIQNAAVHEVSQEDASLASGVQSAMQQIGGALGLAVLATIALRHTAGQVSHGVAQATAATNGYVLAFRIGAIVTAVGGVLVLTLFEKVRPTQDDGEAVEVGSSPANADAGNVQPA
jgi:EmrB/QacA subfamily drug resistance transporter